MKSTPTHALRVAVVYHGAMVKDQIFAPDKLDTITLGHDPGNTLIVPPVGLPEGFVLFRQSADGLELHVQEGLEGRLHVRNESYTPDAFIASSPWAEPTGDASYRTLVSPGDWGVLRVGEVEIVWQFVLPPKALSSRAGIGGLVSAAAAGLSGLVSTLGVGILLSLLAQSGFLFYAFWSYDPAEAELLAELQDDRWVEIMASDVDEAEEELLELEEDDPSLEDASQRASGEEGKFGEEDPEDPETVLPDLDARMAESLPDKVGLQDALSSDLLGPEGGAAALFGDGDMFSEDYDQVAMAGDGDAFNPGLGYNGMGHINRGTGGGGSGTGRIGGLADHDDGGGRGPRKKLGEREKVTVKPVIKIDKHAQEGSCSPAHIRDVVKRKATTLRNCYERQLIAHPELAGKVQLQWKIMVDGSVSDPFVKSSTLRNDKAETCMLRSVRRMRFDKPTGGAICVIQFPFSFQSGK